MILPWPKEQFIKTSVEIAAEGDWVIRFNKVMSRAASVRVLGELQMPGTAIGLDYCNLSMIGLARLYARSLDLGIAPLAVSGMGFQACTGSFVRYWRMHGLQPTVIPPPSSEPTRSQFEIRTNSLKAVKTISKLGFGHLIGMS